LCDDCDLKMIKDLAYENSFDLQSVFQRNTVIEKNYIFKIVQRQ
jgi:hypothetical protein